MKLLVSVNEAKQYDILKEYIDGVVVGLDKFCAYSSGIFCVDEILSLSDKCQVYVLLNALIHEYDLEELKKTILSLCQKNIHFIVSDLGAFYLLKKMGLQDKTIYNPETLITNYKDAQTYPSMEGIALSDEIPLDDAEIISEYTDNCFYLAFGYHPMYRSYRKILSLYKEETGKDFSLSNLTLREVTRNDHFPIVENEMESVVFRPGVISCIYEYEKLHNMKFVFMDGIFLDPSLFNEAVRIYSLLLKGKMGKEEALTEYKKLNIHEDNSFMDKDSHYEVG